MASYNAVPPDAESRPMLLRSRLRSSSAVATTLDHRDLIVGSHQVEKMTQPSSTSSSLSTMLPLVSTTRTALTDVSASE